MPTIMPAAVAPTAVAPVMPVVPSAVAPTAVAPTEPPTAPATVAPPCGSRGRLVLVGGIARGPGHVGNAAADGLQACRDALPARRRSVAVLSGACSSIGRGQREKNGGADGAGGKHDRKCVEQAIPLCHMIPRSLECFFKTTS